MQGWIFQIYLQVLWIAFNNKIKGSAVYEGAGRCSDARA